MRCSIAHAKGDVDEYIAVPTVSDSEIGLEIELIKYVAYEALKACSEIKHDFTTFINASIVAELTVLKLS